MTPRLHHVPFSRSFRVLFLLCEMGIDPEIVEYSITDGSLRHPDYMGKSLAGRVPALEIDGITMSESGAITEYLCETRASHGLGRAVGHPERPAFLEWVHFAETQGHLIANLNLQWVFLRDPATRSKTLLKLDTMRLELTLRTVEARLTGRDHILSGGFSGADTMLVYNLLAAAYFVRLDPFPAIRAYLARVGARPGFVRARELDGPQKFYDRDFYEVANA
ncbi:glutathione S-transferase family protein [Albidovulum sediminicola]|uniref:Glutathione S-transferase family protein n=1 Tax=Albidovulum sediminicola TaxID=2984331 RepID=A0ABT2YXU4_9RHOB|nr:glutathione S-transferase family protein [Defluviimonas sp. WL0075]MCV2863696.1 glutathione S-transferase family protein [Defluviimonas sp. WL0075]